MTNDQPDSAWKALNESAYTAFDRGELSECLPLFQQLAKEYADRGYYEYMLGLVHKYRRDWADSIQHNLRSISESAPDSACESERWNIAIAASALGNWSLAREHWIACGISLEPGDAPLDAEQGIVSVRLNPWGSGETLYAQRIGFARGSLINIPFPESGYRFGDLVLLDGAQTGKRKYGNAEVPVFNALQRLKASKWRTHTVRVECASNADAEVLESLEGPGIGLAEDWTRSRVNLCKSCSYGVPHKHADREPDEEGWVRERTVGIAATSRAAVDNLLDAWVAEGTKGQFLERLARRRPRRAVLEIDDEEAAEHPLVEGETWWMGPETATAA